MNAVPKAARRRLHMILADVTGGCELLDMNIRKRILVVGKSNTSLNC